jgi:hypothetical protein
MAFCNIQIGGSVFTHNETRSKQFTAALKDRPSAALHTKADWAQAHEDMYEAIFRWLEDCRAETRTKDLEDMNEDVGKVVDASKRIHLAQDPSLLG